MTRKLLAAGLTVVAILPFGCGSKSGLRTVPPTTCGDGELEFPEQCDDGNRDDTDACPSTCLPARCGDGFVRAGREICDDGNQDDGDACTSDCTLPSCGNGVVEPGEECDDGNDDDQDACRNVCLTARCGDGVVNVINEQCDAGDDNEDRPAFELLQAALRRGVTPLYRAQDAFSFYGYTSASAHTGYESLGGSRMYLYADLSSAKLSLFVHHGIDIDSSGLAQPESVVTMSIQGVPAAASVLLFDDNPEEFFQSGPGVVTGDWWFQNNSDGGVIGSLPFPGAWELEVTPDFQMGIGDWRYVDGDDSLIELLLNDTATLRAYDTPSPCRTSCSKPRCGDGILDGGEQCDDGNADPTDGCSSQCTVTQPGSGG